MFSYEYLFLNLIYSAGTAMTAARSAGRDNLLNQLNPMTRLGLAILASLPMLISLDWVSSLTMLIGQTLVFLA